MTREQADVAYHEWVLDHLKGKTHPTTKRPRSGRRKLDFRFIPRDSDTETTDAQPQVTPESLRAASQPLTGSLLHVASGLLRHEEARVRPFGEKRRQGTIHQAVLVARKQFISEFLEFMNSRHGQGAVGRMLLADLSMGDVEAYNRVIVKANYSENVVVRRLQAVKSIIDRAGRPEYGGQLLKWNWDSRDVLHGAPAKKRLLPTAAQLRTILDRLEDREKAMVWMGIGLGFGQLDIAQVRVGQIDERSYDLRRSKTGIERFGETPPMVWNAIQAYLAKTRRPLGELLFVTRKGLPVVHGNADSVQQWWYKQRQSLGKDAQCLSRFYSLRHLGATEFGSRPGCSISEMKRWLGHGASSQMADVYMKPVIPETREVIDFVREALTTGEMPKLKTPNKS
jgi:integrase